MNLKRIIKEEMDDMQWIQDIPDNLNDIKFTHIDEPSKVYTIRDTEILPRRNDYHSYISVLDTIGPYRYSVRRKNAYSNFKNGIWIIYDEKINESNDFDWIRDVQTNQDIAQEIADKTEIKDNGIHTPFSSYPSSPFLPPLSLPVSLFFTYCEEQYGLNEEDSKDVWDRYKKIIKDKVNNLNESNDFDWIRDVQTNQDIAQEIADKTEIKDNGIYPPFSPFSPPLPFPFSFFSSFPLFAPLFFTYCEEQYGLNEEDSKDVWNRYREIIKDKANNLNESNDMEWIEDIKSNQDIAQEIADKTEIKNNRIHTPFLPHFSFPLNTNDDILSGVNNFFTYCEEHYGLSEEDSKDVWDRYKNIIKVLNSNINRFRLKESDFEWIEDIKSNQDIAQEIADKTEIKNNRIHTPFSLPPSTHNISHHPLHFHLSLLSIYPYLFFLYCEEQYGLSEEESEDVWERYRKILIDLSSVRGMMESNDMEWIEDIKSNQDIAQEIADKTEIKNNRIYSPIFPSYPSRPLSLLLQTLLFNDDNVVSLGHQTIGYQPFPSLKYWDRHMFSYCEEQYGLNEEDSKDVWDRYREIIMDKIDHQGMKDLNEEETNDFKWMEDIEPFYKVSEGDYIKVIAYIRSRDEFLDWLGDYKDPYLMGEYGTEIEGLVVNVFTNLNSFNLKEKNTGDLITFPLVDREQEDVWLNRGGLIAGRDVTNNLKLKYMPTKIT